MGIGSRLLWGGLGWVLAGPIGGIIGFTLATMSEQREGMGGFGRSLGEGQHPRDYPRTRAGDFAVSLLVLLASVMKADKELLKSELNYVKRFLSQHFGPENAGDFMILFRDILKQDYSLVTVCRQIRRHLDHPGRLEMIHVLFGLSQADGKVHPAEIAVIEKISRYLGISHDDFESIKGMFVQDTTAAYRILNVDPDASPEEIKRAYRRMASKYHPDKVQHLGEEIQKLAEEKFKSINEAYQKISRAGDFR
ncbi:MAG: TerB family tellurite resistance protein [Fidelibacterota bacterium]